MQKRDFFWLGTLGLLGAFIWWRDRSWLAAPADVLPILAGLPLFAWLRWPLVWQPGGALAPGPILVAAGLFAAGGLLGSNLLLTLSWVMLLGAWLSHRVADGASPLTRRLLVLPLFSFPWVVTDATQLGWWFRLSGAAAAEAVLGLGGARVARDGTFLSVNGFQLSVEPACSGLNGLQSMLIAGTMLAYVMLRRHPLYWPALLVLPLAAWLANFLRIFSAAVVALVLEGPAAGRWVGPVHDLAGALALLAMFAGCWGLFAGLARVKVPPVTWSRADLRRLPWLELAILGYAGWRCRTLFSTWFTNPYDRLGWLAFAVWILPLGLDEGGAPRAAGSGARRPWYLGLGLLLIAFGDLGRLNAAQYVGLALIVIGFAPRHRRGLWGLAAIAWMPPLGWVASRYGIHPDAAGMVRVVVAMAACDWAVGVRESEFKNAELNYVGRITTSP